MGEEAALDQVRDALDDLDQIRDLSEHALLVSSNAHPKSIKWVCVPSCTLRAQAWLLSLLLYMRLFCDSFYKPLSSI